MDNGGEKSRADETKSLIGTRKYGRKVSKPTILEGDQEATEEDGVSMEKRAEQRKPSQEEQARGES